jgi:predicted naringenin-chalcone synthase
MRILQLSIVVPKSKYSTKELIEAFPCQIPEGVRQNILNLGVSKRHLTNAVNSSSKSKDVLSENTLVNLCVEASEQCIERADLSASDIGYFIATYDASPFLCPGLSSLLARKLGFKPYSKHVNVQGMACAAFPTALELAEDHLAAHPEDYVLLCISGVNSYWFCNQVQGMEGVMEIEKIGLLKDESKRDMELRKWIATMEFFLFGDGVASVVVANKGDGLALCKMVNVTNLRISDYLAGYARLVALNEPFKFGFHSHLDKDLPRLGVQYTSVAFEKLLGKKAEHKIDAIKKWAIHTGSKKILDEMTKHYHIPHEKVEESYRVLAEYGNLAGASLPFILEKIISKNAFSKNDLISMLDFGWGFSASACLLEFLKQQN